MSLPQPKTPLNNACSVVFDNTLYTYSADAFQSLRLEPGAKWKELPQKEKVAGGVCVGSTTGNPATSAFFVVGGAGGSGEYKGLQKYTYSTGQWENIPFPNGHQRVGHSAVYLNSTDSILVFAGVQDGSGHLSSDTFLVGAAAPYSFSSVGGPSAPASVKPILLPWSTSEAVLVGPTTANTKVYLFSIEKGWVDSEATLAAPLPAQASAVLMTGDDGSKNLVTFDMSVSPNVVGRTVLFKGPGIPVSNAAPARRDVSKRKEHGFGGSKRRDSEPLTWSNWPAYNSTLAPTVTRSNYAFAQGPDGMVVIAGGNDDDVLRVFDAKRNTWEDTESMFSQVSILSTETTTSASSSTTTTSESTSTSTSTSTASSTSVLPSTTAAVAATQTPTETAVAAASGSSGPPLNTILGAALGGFFGLAILLILAYLCIKRRKRRNAHMEAGHVRRASGASSSEKDGIGFAKDAYPLGQGHGGVFRGHQAQGSHSSISSLAILMGRSGQQKSTPSRLSRKVSNDSRRDSSDDTFRAFKSTISKPMLQTTPADITPRPPQSRDEKGVAFAATTAEPRPRNLTTERQGSTRRSSGWNRYWSGGSALNLLGFGSGNSAANNSRRVTVSSDQSSNYSDQQHRMTQDSATVPPLQVYESRMSFSRVNAHSPTIAVYNAKLKEEMSGQIETGRPVSGMTDGSASAYSSGIPESVQEAWDPTAVNKPWGADRSLNGSYSGFYATALTPASQGAKPSTQAPPRPPREPQEPVRDDMSWLKLGGN